MKCLGMFTKNETLIAGKFEANLTASLAKEGEEQNNFPTLLFWQNSEVRRPSLAHPVVRWSMDGNVLVMKEGGVSLMEDS